MINGYKPQLLPNNKAGDTPDWEERIERPEEWLYSNKKDGGRVVLFADGSIRGRSLKALPSKHMNQMARQLAPLIGLHEHTIIDLEFYAHDMTFSEIMHFFKTEDVTSAKTIAKYKKLWEKSDQGANPDIWKFKGRDWQWLTTWHDDLKFHAFDLVGTSNPHVCKTKRHLALGRYYERYVEALASRGMDKVDLELIQQIPFEHIDQLYQAYDQAILDGYEGLVVVNKDSQYKYGRHTLNAKQIFKIKEDNLQFDGVVLDVLESTVAREGAPKTVNELGRSVTSKLKEDRIPSGMAKGFLVRLPDGQTMTVSLKDYTHEERKQLLEEKQDAIGHTIRFTGMAPVKEGGCPRHAHYTKGNVRDSK